MGRLKVGKFQTGCMATIGAVFLVGVVLLVYALIVAPAENTTTRPEHGHRGGESSPFAGDAKPRAADRPQADSIVTVRPALVNCS